jgi:DNA recombination protein RmuC
MSQFLLGLLIGAAAVVLLLIPRYRLERETARREIALVAGNRAQFAEQMKAISADTLQQVSGQLEKLAAAQRVADRATAAGELSQRSQEIKRSLEPIADNLKRVSEEVARLERDRRTTHGEVRQMFETMTEEVGRLREQTGTLVTALRRPQVRGQWGELQLRNCVAAANMTEHVDFASQVSVNGSDGGRLRPDLVVHLPADRDIVVDAKVPMDAYLRGAGGRAHAARARRREGRADRHADDADRAAARDLLRLAPGEDRGVGPGDRGRRP